MRKIKTANGIKRIEDMDSNAALFRLRDILGDHRSILATRIMSDLKTYIDYKFGQRTDSRQLESVKDGLQAMKNSILDLDKYQTIVDHFFNHDMTYVSSEPFMQEIDDTIATALNLPQLKLVN